MVLNIAIKKNINSFLITYQQENVSSRPTLRKTLISYFNITYNATTKKNF